MTDNIERLINWHTPPRVTTLRRHVRLVPNDRPSLVAGSQAPRHAADTCSECGTYFTHPHDIDCPISVTTKMDVALVYGVGHVRTAMFDGDL